MKKIFFKTTLLFGVLAIVAIGCTKKIDEAYANPNADVKVPVEQLLPGIISTMGANGAGHGPYNDYRYLGKYIQNWHFYLANDIYDQMSSRLIPLGSTAADQTASAFRAHYYDIGQNNMNMIKWAAEDKKWDYVGVGKAIFAWSWLQLTDLQGDCILNEAFDQSKLTFTYQPQEEVYAYVRNLCHEAIAYLSMTGDGVSQANLALGDAFMYGGDVNKWKKFVYAILARSYNHVSNKAEYKPDSVIKYCDLSFATNDDNAMQKFAYVTGGVSASANFFGPFRNNLNGTVAGSTTANRQGAYIVNLMNGTNSAFAGVMDPRAIYMLRKNNNGTFKGVERNKGQAAIPVANDRPENFHGIPQATASNTSPSNDNNCRYIFRNTAPLPVITAAEVRFMKAEAAYRKGDKLMAWNAYKEAILLNFDMLRTTYNVNIPVGEEITDASRDAYMANPAIVPVSFNDITLTRIMLQKYIALYAIGVFETWVDMRRFHYTDNDPVTGAQVYKDLVIPTQAAGDIHPNNLGRPVYRVYPRYNSETIWNIAELRRIGADRDDYHTMEMWFSKP
jgi:hypothetical protein